jgi:enoyl-CoA hydratase
MSDSDAIQYVVDGYVARIWLNRPEKKNALRASMVAELDNAIVKADADPNIRVIVIRGRGNTFSAGMDLDDIRDAAQNDFPVYPGHEEWMRAANRLMSAGTPSVAVIEGHVAGGAHSFMTCFDFASASTEARIGDVYIRQGIMGGVFGHYRIPRMVGLRRAKELIMTGKLLTGAEAADWGLINLAVPPAELDQAVEEFIGQLTNKSPFTLAINKRLLDRSFDLDFQSFTLMQYLTNEYVGSSEDIREGVAAFLEKRKPVWKGR